MTWTRILWHTYLKIRSSAYETITQTPNKHQYIFDAKQNYTRRQPENRHSKLPSLYETSVLLFMIIYIYIHNQTDVFVKVVPLKPIISNVCFQRLNQVLTTPNLHPQSQFPLNKAQLNVLAIIIVWVMKRYKMR